MELANNQKTIQDMFNAQKKSTEMWVDLWRTHNKDASSVRNAAFSIGKLSAIYHMMVVLGYATEETWADFSVYDAIWLEL